MMPTVIFVHGACVRDAALAVPLPSCGETGDPLGDLADDVEACRQAIREVDGPVVLCGHSYGGMVITEAGTDERVTRLTTSPR
jgi:thioesterase domain-containing protein